MISIIVPVYNAESFLDECIDSIVQQCYTEFECILVDDGSIDRSGAICDQWAERDSRIQVLHKQNGGVSNARNVGIERATGDYLTFIDSDDLVAPTYLSDMVSVINENSELFVSGFILYPIKPGYRPSIPAEQCTFVVDNVHIQQFIQLNEQSLLYGPIAKLYRTSIVRENGLKFNPQLSLGEDLHFNYDYLKYVNQITTVPKANYFYREVGDASLSNKYRDNLFDLSYEQWQAIKNFYVTRDMWNGISKRYVSHLLWAFVYDGIFEFPKRKENSYHYLENILSIPEITYLKEHPNEYHCAKWIKFAIIHRCTWIFYLYFMAKK